MPLNFIDKDKKTNLVVHALLRRVHGVTVSAVDALQRLLHLHTGTRHAKVKNNDINRKHCESSESSTG